MSLLGGVLGRLATSTSPLSTLSTLSTPPSLTMVCRTYMKNFTVRTGSI